jgi:serine/threonine protein phosphatase PrpC
VFHNCSQTPIEGKDDDTGVFAVFDGHGGRCQV